MEPAIAQRTVQKSVAKHPDLVLPDLEFAVWVTDKSNRSNGVDVSLEDRKNLFVALIGQLKRILKVLFAECSILGDFAWKSGLFLVFKLAYLTYNPILHK